MKKHVLSVLVENHSGVLSRVSGLFSRRGYNIDSLSVGETEDPKISRMTIVADADEYTLEQIKKQLNKLVDVIKIIELKENHAIYRELALIKIAATKENRAEISALSNMLEPYGIKEVIRTGLTALERGEKELKN